LAKFREWHTSTLMWGQQCHKPPMTGKGLYYTTYQNGDLGHDFFQHFLRKRSFLQSVKLMFRSLISSCVLCLRATQ
jgi:hypothetical protein